MLTKYKKRNYLKGKDYKGKAKTYEQGDKYKP